MAVGLSAAAIVIAAWLPGDADAPVGDGGRLVSLADVARNLILFAPFGASLGWAGIGFARATLIGAVLSAVLEVGQLAIPGRDPSVLDVVSNTAGAAIGAAFCGVAPGWLRPSAAAARRFSLVSASCAVAIFFATGLLFAPLTPARPLAIQLPPDFEHLAAYEGRILGAWLDGVALPNGPIRDPEQVPVHLEGDYELRVAAVASSPPSRVAALLVITAESGEVAFLGIDHTDLIYRYLSRAGALGLETPRVRLGRALRRVSAGIPMTLQLRRAGPDLCIAVSDAEECSLGVTVGDGWMLLAPGTPESAARRLLAALWIASVFVPVGYWAAASRRPLAPCAIAGAGLLLAAPITGLLATPLSQLVAGLGGLLAGRSLWRMAVAD
jgi:hypothetical protein